MIGWWKAHHGIATDAKYATVRDRAGDGVTVGHVVAIWLAVLDCASQSKPRGNTSNFDAETVAACYGWPQALVERVFAAFSAKGMIDADGIVARWPERNQVKRDKTAAARMQRYRDREKQKTSGASNAGEAGAESHESLRRNGVVTQRYERDENVTPTEEKEQSKSSFSDSSKQDTNTSLKSDTPRIVRERGRAFINPGEFWTWAEANGVPMTFGLRRFQARNLGEWITQGLTDEQAAEALQRARAARQRTGNAAPVNLGYLACFLEEVLAGEPPRDEQQSGGGNERGDELSREFARVG